MILFGRGDDTAGNANSSLSSTYPLIDTAYPLIDTAHCRAQLKQ